MDVERVHVGNDVGTGLLSELPSRSDGSLILVHSHVFS